MIYRSTFICLFCLSFTFIAVGQQVIELSNVKGEAEITNNRTPEQAKKLAIEDAKRNAMREAHVEDYIEVSTHSSKIETTKMKEKYYSSGFHSTMQGALKGCCTIVSERRVDTLGHLMFQVILDPVVVVLHEKKTTSKAGEKPAIEEEKEKLFWENYFKDSQNGMSDNEKLQSPKRVRLGGPSNAWLSLAVPGLGDFFVNENMYYELGGYKVIYPYITLAAWGLIGTGIYYKLESNSAYDTYHKANNQNDMNKSYDIANNGQHKFLIFSAAGSAIWIADIIAVAAKGKVNQRNNKLTKTISIEPYYNFASAGLTLKLKLNP